MMPLRRLLIFLFIGVSCIGRAQEFNIGENLAMSPAYSTFSLGFNFEYRFTDRIISVNLDPSLYLSSSGTVATVPIYLSFSIGETLRICPHIGGFARSNARYGWLTGLNIEYSITEKMALFVKGDLMVDHYNETIQTTVVYYDTLEIEPSAWFGAGVKWNVL